MSDKDVRDWWEGDASDFQDVLDLDVEVDYGAGAPPEREIRLLNDVDGRDVVELGCGGGQCGIALAKQGANVTGIDFSKGQLNYAQDLAKEHDVDVSWIQGDVTTLPVSEDRWDVALSANAFQWVDDLTACFTEAYRVLRPGGIFVFSVPHPFLRIVDEDTHRVEESYFDTGRWVPYENADEEGNDMVTYFYRVSDIVNALFDAGFETERLLEPGSVDPDYYEYDIWSFRPEIMSKVPPTLVIKATKPE